MEKRCTRCKKVKPFSAFSKDVNQKNRRSPRCKQCWKIHNKQYYVASKERLRKRAEEYRTNHLTKTTLRQCATCKKLKLLTEFYKSDFNWDGYLTVCKKCRDVGNIKANKKHKERNREYARRRGQTPSGKASYIRANHKRKALLKLCAINDVTSDQIKSLLKVAFLCAIGEKPFNKRRKKTIDHIFPLSKGGNNTLSNLQVVCRSCNSSKSNKIPNSPGHTVLSSPIIKLVPKEK